MPLIDLVFSADIQLLLLPLILLAGNIMQDLADSTTNIDTHSKLLSYLQPCNDSLIQSKSAYDWGDGVTVNYATVTATIRLSSSHHRQMSSSSSADEPHLNDCRSPSCRDDVNKEALSRPINRKQCNNLHSSVVSLLLGMALHIRVL